MKRYMTLSVLLISLVAVGAYAQAEGDPTKEQMQNEQQLQIKENIQSQEQLQNQDETQNQEQVNSQEQVGTQSQLQTRKNNEVLEGDKSLEGEKPQTGVKEQVKPEDPIREIGSDDNAQNPGNGTADRKFVGPNDSSGDKALEGEKPQTGVQERIQPEDPIREIGSDENAQNPGNGTADRKFVGPNDSTGDKVLDGECDGDQTREMNHGDADGTGDGDNHELGESHRRGGDDEFADGTGPHGPMDHGDKALDGTFGGEMLQHRWGPGGDGIGGPFGPNIDHAGHGQGGRVDDGDPTKSARGQARAGRR